MPNKILFRPNTKNRHSVHSLISHQNFKTLVVSCGMFQNSGRPRLTKTRSAHFNSYAPRKHSLVLHSKHKSLVKYFALVLAFVDISTSSLALTALSGELFGMRHARAITECQQQRWTAERWREREWERDISIGEVKEELVCCMTSFPGGWFAICLCL